MTTVRRATTADLSAVAAIYDEQVRTGISTFDLEAPGLEYWQHRLDSTEPGDHFLVAETDGAVVGFAYSSSYRPRPGYRLTRETLGVPDRRRPGPGPRPDLLRRAGPSHARRRHPRRARTGRASEPGSVALHESCGFDHLGTMREVGRKFDRWLDTAWYQRLL